jgi:hypothetical protein
MPTTFYNLTVTIDEDDPRKAYEILGDLIDQPTVRIWTSDTYSVDRVMGDKLIPGEKEDTSDLFE